MESIKPALPAFRPFDTMPGEEKAVGAGGHRGAGRSRGLITSFLAVTGAAISVMHTYLTASIHTRKGKEITKMETNNPEVVTPIDTPSELIAHAPTARPFKPIDFYKRFLKQNIQCKCTNGIVIKGILIAYNPYELCIGVAGGEEIILSKHAVMFTTLVKGENEVAADGKESIQ